MFSVWSKGRLARLIATLLICSWLAASTARAVILLGTADPSANTTAPTGTLANSGWQFAGSYGGFVGTPIAPNFFITAAHIGGAPGTVFVFNGVSYNVVEGYLDSFSDFRIWRVDGTFPTFAPLYPGPNETGQRLVVIGRGTQRGAEVIQSGTLRGWLWGAGDSVQRWGENFVTGIVRGGTLNELIYATFDASGSANEAHLSVGDSGGAVFIQNGGIWKLAGIAVTVDGPFFTDSAGGGSFNGVLFDARDFYEQDSENPPHYTLIAAPSAVPTGFYATRLSSKLPYIYSVIDPAGDANGDGVSNLVDYARSLNAPDPVGLGEPAVMKESGSLSIVYRKLVMLNAPQYLVQSSSDLCSWSAVTPSETVVAVIGEVQTVKATVPATGSRLFLRVLISPPS